MRHASVYGAAFLLGVALFGCGFQDMAAASAQASKALDALFQSLDQGTWLETYETKLAPEFRNVTSKADYEKLGQTIHDRMGKLTSKEQKQFFVRNWNGVLTVEASYDAQFEKGKGTLRASLKKVGENWLVLSFAVNSPEFLGPATVPCASCGKPRPKDAAFCPACGKKVDVPPTPGK